MKSITVIDGSDCGDAVVDEGKVANNAIIVNRRVLDLEQQGYVVRRETYRVTPEMNPETGRIIHLHTVELYQATPGRS
jgi:hypothetical protein